MDKPKQQTGGQSGQPGAVQEEAAVSTRSPGNIISGQNLQSDYPLFGVERGQGGEAKPVDGEVNLKQNCSSELVS